MKITLSTPARSVGHDKHNGRQRRTNCVLPQYCRGRRKWKLWPNYHTCVIKINYSLKKHVLPSPKPNDQS
ncbi:hypothetical protein ALC53_05611 [Atta colombica]|uniref:Uncharacterized protein n=1 Tax=Atta colombica TaxID=520822 RepID=A0A151I3V8_9HYME|nr:hypothetical protein ALC53_05611 [Atta colombica]